MDFSVVFPFVQSPFPPVSPPTRTSVSSWKYKLKTELSDCAPCLVLMQSVMHALFFRKSRHAEGKTRVRLRPSASVDRDRAARPIPLNVICAAAARKSSCHPISSFRPFCSSPFSATKCSLRLLGNSARRAEGSLHLQRSRSTSVKMASKIKLL